jgi:hypothetical protein
MVAGDLAAQPDAGQAAGDEDGLLGRGHGRRLSNDELEPAGGAPGVSAAGVELIDFRLVFQCQNQPLPPGHVDRSHSLDRKLRHGRIPFYRTGNQFRRTADRKGHLYRVDVPEKATFL